VPPAAETGVGSKDTSGEWAPRIHGVAAISLPAPAAITLAVPAPISLGAPVRVS